MGSESQKNQTKQKLDNKLKKKRKNPNAWHPLGAKVALRNWEHKKLIIEAPKSYTGSTITLPNFSTSRVEHLGATLEHLSAKLSKTYNFIFGKTFRASSGQTSICWGCSIAQSTKLESLKVEFCYQKERKVLEKSWRSFEILRCRPSGD